MPFTANNITAPVSPKQFAFFRIALGIYLLIHFAMLIPYAAELWSHDGILPDAHLNFTYGLFPNLLYWFDSASFVTSFLVLLTFLSLLLLLGYQRQWVCLALWYGWVCLFNRNNFISNPGIPYVGWLLLVMALIPKGEPWSLTIPRENWQFPLLLFWGAWALMAVGYSLSGWDKWHAPSWANGDAIKFLLENPLARNGSLRFFLLNLPNVVLKCLSWLILIVEVVFLPFSIWKSTRPFAWLAMVIVHLGILCLVDFADLTVGMLMIHLFTFDNRWIIALKAKS